jgi:hypothetical protein
MKRILLPLLSIGFLICVMASCAPQHCVGISGTGNTATASHQRGGHCAGVKSTGTYKPHVPKSKARENGNFDPRMEKQLAKSKAKPIEKKKLEYK